MNMKGLIKYELISIFKGISFYICLLSIIVLSISGVGTLAVTDVLFSGADIKTLAVLGYSGKRFLLLSPSQSDFALLIGVLATINVCLGYSSKTYRNFWSRGFSRLDTFIGKAVAISVASVIFCIASMITGFITGLIFWGAGDFSDIKSIVLSIILEILICIAIGLLYLATAFIFKNMGISIVIAVASPSLMTIGSTVIDYILEYKNLGIRFSQFILSNELYDVAEYGNNEKVLATAFLCFAAYFITALVAGYLGMRKDEI